MLLLVALKQKPTKIVPKPEFLIEKPPMLKSVDKNKCAIVAGAVSDNGV